MAIMPGAEWLGAHHDNGVMSRYDIVCVHTIVGYAPAHAAHFSTRWDGHVYQSRDTYYRSAANLNGNYRVIAIENEDHGPAFGTWGGSDVPGFTEAQKEAIARIIVWAYHTHGIPIELAPDSKPGSRGIAYHRQGIDGNFGSFAYGGRVAGGEVWTSSPGKICPGDNRIRQLINEIIPRARVLAGLEEEEMNEAQWNTLNIASWRDYWKNQGVEVIPATQGMPAALVGEKIPANVIAADTSWRAYAGNQGWTEIPQQPGIPQRLWGEKVPVNKTVADLKVAVAEANAKADVLEAKLDQVLALLSPQS